jgi:hypothetical protein
MKKMGNMMGKGGIEDSRRGQIIEGSDYGRVGHKHPKWGGGMGPHHAVRNDSIGSPFEGKGVRGTTRMEAGRKPGK